MITQKLDESDSVLGFTVGWVRALAARVEHLHVLCLERRTERILSPLPGNVTTWSMGKDRGASRLGELQDFHRVLSSVGRLVDVIFSHMSPRYAWLSAPYAALFRKKLMLWYVHRRAGLELRLATHSCDAVLTAVSTSFPVRTDKLHVLGHGIDSDFFSPDPRGPAAEGPLIVHVARLMRIKHQETLLRALATGIAARAVLIGEALDAGYATFLHDLTGTLGLAGKVTFTGARTPPEVRDLYRRATVAVNLTPEGSFDKAALESMLVGVPTIVASPAFDTLCGDPRLRIDSPTDAQGLADRLRTLISLPAAEREGLGRGLRERARAGHDLDRLMNHLVAFMEAGAHSSSGSSITC